MKELRPINFKEFIPTQRDADNNVISGTGRYTEEYRGSGFFHKWISFDYDIQALVQLQEGTMLLVPYNMVKFKTDNTNGSIKSFQIDVQNFDNLIEGYICKGLSKGEVVNQFEHDNPHFRIINVKEL